jgi:hypothetical protein
MSSFVVRTWIAVIGLSNIGLAPRSEHNSNVAEVALC